MNFLPCIVCFGKFASDSTLENDRTTNFKKGLKQHESRAMFVGTYADQVSTEDFEKIDAKLQQAIERVGSGNFNKALVYAKYDEDEEKRQLMLKVDNKNGGEEEIFSIRKLLLQRIRTYFDQIPVPASWFVLSLRLRCYKSPTLTLSECKMLAAELKIGPKELQTALWFLHHGLGLLLYPVGDLKDVVFCQIQAIYKSITNLIKKTYTDDHVRHPLSLDEFKNLGVLSLKEIGNETPESPVPRDLLV